MLNKLKSIFGTADKGVKPANEEVQKHIEIVFDGFKELDKSNFGMLTEFVKKARFFSAMKNMQKAYNASVNITVCSSNNYADEKLKSVYDIFQDGEIFKNFGINAKEHLQLKDSKKKIVFQGNKTKQSHEDEVLFRMVCGYHNINSFWSNCKGKKNRKNIVPTMFIDTAPISGSHAVQDGKYINTYNGVWGTDGVAMYMQRLTKQAETTNGKVNLLDPSLYVNDKIYTIEKPQELGK